VRILAACSSRSSRRNQVAATDTSRTNAI
jgi:hypothetical protein